MPSLVTKLKQADNVHTFMAVAASVYEINFEARANHTGAVSGSHGRLPCHCCPGETRGKQAMVRTLMLLAVFLVPAIARAQFTYTNHHGYITITGYTGPGGVVTIPRTIDGLPVTTIGERAFFLDTRLTGVTIPDSVRMIGVGAFYLCTKLTNVTINQGVLHLEGSAEQ